MPDFRYEGVSFFGTSANSVFRFRRRDTGVHFYTSSVAEYNNTLQNLSATYEYEGWAGFYATTNQDSSALQPVYRFYDAGSGSHFFTASEGERDAVSATLPNFRYEGVAFYVGQSLPLPPAPSGALDEDWYLRAYPDVRDAVIAGTITARTHYEAFGRNEGRLPNDLAALAGNDSFTAYDSAPGFVRVLNGGAGNDVLDGLDDHGVQGGTPTGGWSDADDRLFGETGDDSLMGAQNDSLDGGSGNDSYTIHSGGVHIMEGLDSGADTLLVREDRVSGAYDYVLPANVELMRLAVSDIPAGTRPTFTGSAGSDFIAASSSYGALRIVGGSGDDTLNGGSGGAVLEGGEGNDYLVAGAQYLLGRFTIVNTSGSDTMDGGAGNDTLAAWCGDDRLTGGTGRDTLLIDLGAGPNVLWQDSSAPTSVFSLYLTWRTGTTTVTDFTPGEDVLSFRHTSLGLSDVMARFQDRATGSPAVQASFDVRELGLDLTGATAPYTFTLVLEGLTTAQMSTSWFSVSAS